MIIRLKIVITSSGNYFTIYKLIFKKKYFNIEFQSAYQLNNIKL